MNNNPFGNYYNSNAQGMMGMNNQVQGNRPNPGYANPNLGGGGMMQQGGGMQQQQNTGYNQQQAAQEKDRQIQQLKSQYPNLNHKQVMNNNQPVDFIELVMQVQAPGVSLQIPMALVLDARFPNFAPKIYIRSKLKHNLFETKDQIIELDPNNIISWTPKTTLVEFFSRANNIFEKDPPRQEKVIEDVNKLLSVVTEQNFRDLVALDTLSQRSVDDLRQLQGISFQELICSSQEYKKIGQNLVDVINFNEKTANELLHKSDELESHKQSLLMVSDTIQSLTAAYNERVNKCKHLKDAFSRQNIEGFVHKEIKNLDSESLSIESIAQQGGANMMEVLQSYLDTRKNYHRLNLIQSKLGELKYH